jgi:sirohydrochlorin cobaltochelatase
MRRAGFALIAVLLALSPVNVWAHSGHSAYPVEAAADASAAAPVESDEPAVAPVEGRIGVLVLAHGGNNQWNGTVRKVVKQADLEQATEVAFGMAMHPEELREFQQAVDKLQRKGVSRIIVVPLLVSSYSEVYRQFEYVFGLRKEAEWPRAGAPLRMSVPVTLGGGLDGSPLVLQVLRERADDLSRVPEKETVVLVAHGPVSEADDQLWHKVLDGFSDAMKTQDGFQRVVGLTIRDDAPKAVRDAAVEKIRDTVRQAGEQGRVLVVPVLLARGGIERKIPKILNGLTYRYSGQTILPHPNVAEWIAGEVQRLSAAR